MALENRLRKPRTAAGFVPEACKTQAWKTLGTSPLKPKKKNMSITAHGLGKPPAKASNSSKIRARSMQNTSLKNSRNVTFGIHKKHVSHGTWPWKTACESLEQQQDSCPKHAKHKPEKLSKHHDTWPWKTALENCLRKPRTAAGFVVEACRTQAWKTLGTSPLESIENMSITAHGLGKPPAKAPWKTLGTSPLESMKNMFLTAHDWKTASESLEQQQDSCPKHAKHKPEKLSERHLWSPLKKKTCLSRHMALEACKTQAWKTLRTSLENSSIAMALENRLRKPRTAAGFVPEACKTQARKTLGTSPLKPIKKNMSITAHGLGSMQNTSLKNSQNVTREHWCPSGWLRQPSRPQHSSSTRISPRWLGQQDIQCPPDRFRKTRTAASTKHVGKPNS